MPLMYFLYPDIENSFHIRITNPVHSVKSSYHIVPSPSTALSADFPMIFALDQEIFPVANVKNIFRGHNNNNKQNNKVVEAKWGW